MERKYLGICAGLMSGVLWGIPFVAPLILQNFTPLDITFGRFVFFGLIGLLFIPRLNYVWKSLDRKSKIELLFLSSIGFWVYTLLLTFGIQHSDGVLASLIIGMIPLTITIFSRPKLTPSLIIGIVVLLFGFSCLFSPESISIQTLRKYSSGILVLLVALFMWTIFAIRFARFAALRQHIKSFDLSSIIGVINLFFIIPVYFISGNNLQNIIQSPLLGKFILVCLALGVGASWLANIFWAYCSKVCSSTICGALMVSETVFGCLYSLCYYHRMPSPYELVAIISLFIGMICVIKSQKHV
ncbi:MAG: DMT family transporter [Burkholderiales bacterium]|nr:DMT family transporter [Burkholderiales bacterium]